jgi:photosynthetic reaction center cytochrome c subunit
MTKVFQGAFGKGLAALLFTAALAGCERPPIATAQNGFRGTGMVQVTNPRTTARLVAEQTLPAVIPALPAGAGPTAKDIFKNVQVLGDLPVAEFTRTMLAITSWVAPVQGCAYCHVPGQDLSGDTLYTKVVARRMLQMTRHLNQDWQSHVAPTGVTCFTCHRGQPVPAQVWFTDPGPKHAGGATADTAGQNMPSVAAGLTSLPYDGLTPFLLEDNPIRIEGTTALPTGNRQSVKQTEWTYSLMTHISLSLGVNCTFCHNTRSFADWPQSPPQRAKAFYAIRMARDLNKAYLEPLTQTFPPERLGPLGDVAKVGCATCHQGRNKPLNGAAMLADYPAFGSVAAAAAADASAVAVAADPAASPVTH